jgi:two-component system response regulator FixJ
MTDPGRTVHIVDDDEAIRHSIGYMLRSAGFICAAYGSGTEFLEIADRDMRGCVLLDVRMPGLDGLEVQQHLSSGGINLPIVMLTGHGDVTLAVRAIKAGAIEFLEKPFERSALLKAIEEGFVHAANDVRDQSITTDALTKIGGLTPRERDVLDGMVLGRPNKLIAFDLSIATRTVEVHRANLMQKLSARSLSQALRIAFAAGLGAESQV